MAVDNSGTYRHALVAKFEKSSGNRTVALSSEDTYRVKHGHIGVNQRFDSLAWKTWLRIEVAENFTLVNLESVTRNTFVIQTLFLYPFP